MQDDNEEHAQSILTVAAFTEWLNIVIGGDYKGVRIDTLNSWLKTYLVEHGFSETTLLIDGNYKKYLVLES